MSVDSTVHCDVWELARRGGEVQGELPLRQADRLAAQLVDTIGVLRYRFSGYIDGRGRAAATLRIEGVVRARCDRCAGPVEIPIFERADFYFVADEDELASLPIDEAPEEPLLGSRRFEVATLVEEQAILALPLSPRHDHCALPGHAGDDALAGDEDRRRPFAALATLKRRKQ
jgi:uncharacterized protein